jgi:Ca2+-dependent lipid-binding protein
MEPLITLQCWDADVVSADDFLGSIQLNLTRMIKGADTAKSCRLSMLKNKNKKTVNLFQVKNVRGWWPMAIFDGNKSGRLTVKTF